jgi:hypothetical protein
MTPIAVAGIAAACVAVLACPGAPALAHGPAVAANAEEIGRALKGKTCTTRAGATFTFGLDGRYTYDGLWKNGGRYVIGEGSVTVTFDSGLERAFAISRHDDVFYMEETALRCRRSAPLQA